MIEQSFVMNPVPLPLDLWDIFRKYDLCRTPSEELHHRFKFAKVVDIPQTSFALHMDWMLKRLLLASPATKDMTLAFVDGNTLNINAGFFEDTWRIHDKWLTPTGAHEYTFCEVNDPGDSGVFTCDHAVLQLWDLMISHLMATGNHPDIATQEAYLKSMARGRLTQMLRSIEFTATSKLGELSVLWKSVDSYQNKDEPVKIVLHHEACGGKLQTEG